MKDINRKYLSALHSFVQGAAPETVAAEEWKELMELARIHSTRGILCHVYMRHPGLTDPALLPALRRQCLQEIDLYNRRAEQMRQLAAKLDENEIDFVLFKGFVVRNYYPVPELRTFGDVDILIHKEDRRKSDELMLSLGYTRKDDWEPSYSYRKGTEYYELHSRVIDFDASGKADFLGYFGRIWEHTHPAQVVPLPHARELDPEFHFLYLLTHLAKHISASGAGIRMYLDLALFIRHFGRSLDWDWIVQELEKLRLWDFANVAFLAVQQWFGVESPIRLAPVAEDVMADFLEFTLAGGVYGYVGRDKGLVFLKQQSQNEEKVSKFRTLMNHAFPSADVLVNKYAYLEDHRWMLPVAWVQRLADKRSEWGRFAEHTSEILNADEEQVLKLKRIYKEIGL